MKIHPAVFKFAFVFFLAIAFPVTTPSSVFGFQTGTNGADGVDGDPGTDGEDGTDGADDVGVPTFGTTYAFGTAGGNGGNGGDGIDGDDPDSGAAGGNAGSGGRGGDAHAGDSRQTIAQGGHGGSAGMFGRGTSSSLNGMGGTGGNGGDAFSIAVTDFSTTRSTAYGGRGGNAYGPDAVAGHGGGAFTSNTIGRGSYFGRVHATEYGGSGGTGFIGATGGNGASVEFGNTNDFNIDSDDIVREFSAHIRGVAGSGGDSQNGKAGFGGDATIDLPGLQQQLQGTDPSLTPNYSQNRFGLYGGYGGRGIATGNQTVSGVRGGQAGLVGAATFATLESSTATIDLRGGNGGSAIGSRNRGNGGHGGSAFIDYLGLDNSFPTGRLTTAFIRATMTGGDGGHANGSGRAGNGASVELADTFSISTKIGAELTVTANGGHGGWGKGNGNGGDARIEMADALIQETELANWQNSINFKANGGNAGLGVVGQIAAKGGNASASSIEKTTNRLTVEVTAVGGIGNLGKSGDSFARAHATTLAGGSSNGFRAAANALAESQRIAGFDRVLPSIGTSSTSDAKAVSNSESEAFARSRAVGGWGFLESGSAHSTAHADNKFTGEAVTFSSSFAHGDRNRSTQNFSTSHAHSKAANDKAEATSVAAGTGHFSRIHATAGIDSRVGFAHSETKSSTISWSHSANIKNRVDFVSPNGPAALIDSSSYFGFRQTGFAGTTGAESSVDLLLIPDRTFADSVVAGSDITDVFDQDADVLGLGSIRGGFAGDSFDGELAINSAVDMSLRLQPFHDDKNLILGLFGVESTGDGFEDLSFSATLQGISVIDESFTSLADATAFFDDNLFDFGELNNEETLVDFQFNFSMNVADMADSFKFNFVFGNADPRMPMGPSQFTVGSGNGGLSSVPEPTSGVAIGLTLIGLFHRRRRS